MIERFRQDNPFWQWLGLVIDEEAMGRDVARLVLPLKDELYQHQGMIHGGVLSALIDSAGAWAFALRYEEALRTINLAVQYLEGVGHDTEEVAADARIVRAGRRIVIVDVTVCNERETEVARGQVIYSRAPR